MKKRGLCPFPLPYCLLILVLMASFVRSFRINLRRSSLALTRWVQPFTEQKYFEIEKSKIILTARASAGLCIYYEKCLQAHDAWINEAPDVGELDEIENEELYEELLEELEDNEDKIYH